MVIIGVDSHKQTHTVVAVDGNGRKLAEKTGCDDAARSPRARPLAAPVARADLGARGLPAS
jgi:hypothetical protein